MTGKEIYDALQDYLTQHSVPTWTQVELEEAVSLGITDGKNLMQPILKIKSFKTGKEYDRMKMR